MPATPRIHDHFARLFPGWRIVAIEPLAADMGATRGATEKAVGYGRPARVRLVDNQGHERVVVWRVASAGAFGHDRRSDRAANTLLAFDDFARLPQHITAIDTGAIMKSGELVSLREWDELYLVTSYAPGTIYADDLRRIGNDGIVTDLDRARVDSLAIYLATLHTPIAAPARYRRAIRDLVGHGEGIFGIVDGYPPNIATERVRGLEERCVTWRARLRSHEDRLTRTHGDFHPFNLVFEGTELACLDASRGTCGDPADDLTALAVNFVLFAIDRRAPWASGLGTLWHRFWDTYARLRPDPRLLAAAPPFFAWRVLVVCNPVFYPKLAPTARDELLDLAAHILDAGALDPRVADGLFA